MVRSTAELRALGHRSHGRTAEGATGPTLQFLGAAGTVTGSRHLVTAGDRRVLLDCGLFQGLKELRLRNWDPSGPALAAVDAVVLSHAHIDHSGALPLLVKHGFRGPIYCTPGTAELLTILLPDSGYLQEEDAARANRRGYSRHHPALPLYTREDALRALEYLVVRDCHRSFPVTRGVSAMYRGAGHILGAATVELKVEVPKPVTLVYSGDLGRFGQPIMPDPEPVPAADVLLVESTYGDHVHASNAMDQLARIVSDTARRGAAAIIPAFAVGRTQELLWMLRRLEHDRRIPVLPVYVDSPMAIDVTDIYARHRHDHSLDLLGRDAAGPFRTANFRLARTPDESKAINSLSGPVIIISASGMATGGRVLHHLRLRLPDPRTTVILTGFQAAGTRGRALQDGTRELRMHGQWIPVRATVEILDGLSAHADREDIVHWLSGFRTPPGRTYLVHGEPEPAQELLRTINERLGWNVRLARDGETVDLG